MTRATYLVKYCPFCQRDIAPWADEDGETTLADGSHVYVHDDVPHDTDYTFEDRH